MVCWRMTLGRKVVVLNPVAAMQSAMGSVNFESTWAWVLFMSSMNTLAPLPFDSV